MGTISDKLTYLNTTKGKIKDAINLTNANILSEDTFRSYADKLKQGLVDAINDGGSTIYSNFPKTTQTDTEIALNDTYEAPMTIALKGNTSQETTTGKNLFGYGITAVDNTASYRPNQHQRLLLSATANPNEVKFNYYGNYCLGYIEINGIDGTLPYSISFNIKENTTNYTPNVVVDTTNSTNQKLVIIINGNNKGTSTSSSNYFILTNIQVENGSTSTQYEPYTNGASPNPDYPQEIQVVSGDNTIKVEGKNLFDYKTPNINQITWTPTDNGGLFTSSTYWKNLGNKLELDTTKQYTFSFGARNSDKLYYYIKTYTDETYQRVKTTIVNDGTALSKTFTPDSKYVSIYFANGGILQNVEIPNIQLEESSTKTEFEHYVSQSYPISLGNIELCKIGDYQDYIYKENNKWYKHSEIGKVVLDGSENWNTRAGRTLYAYQLFNVFDGNKTNGLSTHWKFISGGATNSQTEECIASANTNTSLSVFTNNSNLSTLTNFTTWLSNNNMTLYYVLSTPTYTEITDTDLIEQLEELEKAKSVDDKTFISQINEQLPFILDVSALSKN